MDEDRFMSALRQCKRVRGSDCCRVRWNQRKQQQQQVAGAQEHTQDIGSIDASSSPFPAYLEQLLQQLGFSVAEKQAFLREFWKVQADVNQRLALEDLQDISTLLRQETSGDA